MGAGAGRDMDAAAAVELPGIISEVPHVRIQKIEKRLQALAQIACQIGSQHTLHIAVESKVRRPRRAASASPYPLQIRENVTAAG